MSDLQSEPDEIFHEWLRYAEGDLRVAERELTAEEPSYHTICFLCQAAAEKYLKGYLLAQGWKLEKIRDLLILLDRCTQYDSNLNQLLPEGEILNEYIVAGRYPGELSVIGIGLAESTEAVKAAQRIGLQVTTLLNLSGDKE